MKMLDVCTPQKNEKTDKTYWTKIGTAFVHDDGGINVVLSALPLNGKLSLFERKQKQDAPAEQYNAPSMPADDSDLPF